MLPITLENEKPPELVEKELLKVPKLDLFREVIPSLQSTGKDILGDDPIKIKQYGGLVFIVNRAMSQYIDCLPIAVAMNSYPSIPPRTNYLIYLNSIRKYRREFVKWKGDDLSNSAKSEKKADIISSYHGYSKRISREIVDLYTDAQIEKMEKTMEKGG